MSLRIYPTARIVSMATDEFDEEVYGGFEYPHPMAPYDPVKEAALIRERVLAVRAGGKTIPLDEAMAEIRRDLETMPARD